MTLGEFYDKINSWPSDIMNFRIENVFSWRGIYAEPCCEISINATTKQENLDMLMKLANSVFIGWKGGEFTYTFDNNIHFECDESSYTPNNGYLNGFIQRNQTEEIKHIFIDFL